MHSLKTFYYNDRKDEIMNTANVISGSLQKYDYIGDEDMWNYLSEEMLLKSKEGGYRIFIFDKSGVVICDTNGRANLKTYIVPEVLKAFDNSAAASVHEKEKSVYAAASIVNENSDVVGAVLVVSSIEDIEVLLSDLYHNLIIYLVILGGMVSILSAIIGKYFLTPFQKIITVVEKMSQGHLNQRISTSRKDEFGDIADGFNAMAEQLEKVEITREEFVSNVSHELKTPLSSIKVLSESILLQENVPVEMYIEFLQDINSEVDRMTNIVNDLLALVKLDHKENSLNMKYFSLNSLLVDILKRLKPLADRKEVSIEYVEKKEVDLFADEVKLSLAISNLVENGIKYTQVGGKVTVIVDSDNTDAIITVSDTGIGISEEEQTKIFTRFYRVDKTRDRETGGTGLGLSITHSTILLHDGSIKVNSTEGEGTTFVVRLPLMPNKKEG